MSAHIHTIPVDPSLTAIEAFKEICIFGQRVTNTGLETWANVECDGEECRSVEWVRKAGRRPMADRFMGICCGKFRHVSFFSNAALTEGTFVRCNTCGDRARLIKLPAAGVLTKDSDT